MASAAPQPDWVAHMGALTSAPSPDWPADEVGDARAEVALLVASARDLVAACALEPATDPQALSALGAVAGAADLARELAAIPGSTGHAPHRDTPQRCAERFLLALAAAGRAVYTCRKVQHPVHECLFGSERDDLCRRVLAVAHRLGPPAGS